MSNLKSIFIVFVILAFLKCNVSEPQKHTCNFNKENKGICDFSNNVKPGDTIEFICKHDKYLKSEGEFPEDFKDKKLCFNYVYDRMVQPSRLKKIEDFALGVYDVTTVEKEEVTTSTITFPPFMSKAITFNCNCYQKPDPRITFPRVLNVSVPKSPNYKALGCNFNKNESIFPKFGKKSDYDQTKMCNLYNVFPEANLGILCPEGTTIEPGKCFTEVFTYKKWKSRKNKQLKNEETEKVSITKLTNGKPLTNTAGDANNKYATIPGNVNEKFLFFCRCKNSNGSEAYRMNVYVNLTEEQAEAKEAEEEKNREKGSENNLTEKQAKAKEVEKENNRGESSEKNNPNTGGESENTENSSNKQSNKNSVSTDTKKNAASSNHMYVSSLVMLFFTFVLTFA